MSREHRERTVSRTRTGHGCSGPYKAGRTKRLLACSTLVVGFTVSFQTVSADELSGEDRALKLGLPAIESLTFESDYSVFFASNVPVEIRRAALRKLWSLPMFNQTDSLDNYTGDYSAKADANEQAHADFRLSLD